MILAISGKTKSGKNTVASIIQYLTLDEKVFAKTNEDIIADITYGNSYCAKKSEWKQVAFADKLKDIVCLLIGCTREQLEDQDFKDKELGEEWWYWKVFFDFNQEKFELLPYRKENGFYDRKPDYKGHGLMRLTPRRFLQLLGTDCFRNIIHPNTFINSLFSDYKAIGDNLLEGEIRKVREEDLIYPNWIITDCRFPNELQIVKDKKGINIRINSPEFYWYDSDLKKVIKTREGYFDKLNYPNLKPLTKEDPLVLNSKYFHISETALDNTEFDFVIENNGNIEDLVEKVRNMLIHFDLLK